MGRVSHAWNEGHEPAGSWFLCEECGARIEGMEGGEVIERLAAHRQLEHNDPDMAGDTPSAYLAGVHAWS